MAVIGEKEKNKVVMVQVRKISHFPTTHQLYSCPAPFTAALVINVVDLWASRGYSLLLYMWSFFTHMQ